MCWFSILLLYSHLSCDSETPSFPAFISPGLIDNVVPPQAGSKRTRSPLSSHRSSHMQSLWSSSHDSSSLTRMTSSLSSALPAPLPISSSPPSFLRPSPVSARIHRDINAEEDPGVPFEDPFVDSEDHLSFLDASPSPPRIEVIHFLSYALSFQRYSSRPILSHSALSVFLWSLLICSYSLPVSCRRLWIRRVVSKSRMSNCFGCFFFFFPLDVSFDLSMDLYDSLPRIPNFSRPPLSNTLLLLFFFSFFSLFLFLFFFSTFIFSPTPMEEWLEEETNPIEERKITHISVFFFYKGKLSTSKGGGGEEVNFHISSMPSQTRQQMDATQKKGREEYINSINLFLIPSHTQADLQRNDLVVPGVYTLPLD